MGSDANDLRLLWLMLPESRSFRELYWLSQMPGAAVTSVGETATDDPVTYVHRDYHRWTRRFVEAGALAWIEDIDTVPGDHQWTAALEPCAMVTGQAADLARARGNQFAVFTWGNNARNPLYYLPPYRQVLKKVLDQADLFVCLIEAAKDHCMALGVPEQRCAVVAPPMPTDLFFPPDAPVEAPIVTFVSPLATNKGIDRVLDAFDIVRRRLPEAELQVVGSGPLEGLVKQRAKETGGAVKHLGRMDRYAVAEHLRRASVFVTAPRATPVWDEQFGLAYVEAMATGLPVVTTECGTSYEAVSAPNLRVADDANVLAEALLTFLEDPALRARIGVHNREEMVRRYEFRQQVAALGDVFRSFTR